MDLFDSIVAGLRWFARIECSLHTGIINFFFNFLLSRFSGSFSSVSRVFVVVVAVASSSPFGRVCLLFAP